MVNLILNLFLTFVKIGVFTFGGGYAMISFFETEFVNKKKLLNNEEFLDLIAIAESTPGPIAINFATYIGYKQNKFLGALVSTLAICIPSFIIIFIISIFFSQFLAITWVAKAFKGIQVCVVFLILSAGFRLLKNLKITPLNILITTIVIIVSIILSLFSKSFSSILYIILAVVLGLIIYSLQIIKEQSSINKKEDKK